MSFNGKKSKKKKLEPEEVKKIGFRGVWSSLKYNERIYMVFGFILLGVIWLINTISGFMTGV